MEQVLLLGLRKEKTVECCNIAREATSLNKIVATGEQKFPEIVKARSHVVVKSKKKRVLRHGDVQGYRPAALSAVHRSRHRDRRLEADCRKDCKRDPMGGGPIYQIYESE
jgi:hypothetical protein